MCIRWNFRDQPSEDFPDKPVFRPKSNWKAPPGHLDLELFLSQLEKEIFNGLLNDFISIPSNMSKEKWEALRGLADYRSIVIKQADKGSCMVVWCREDYIKEANKQYIKMLTLKKQFYWTWLIKAIEFLRVFTRANLFRRKNSNAFAMISKKQLI